MTATAPVESAAMDTEPTAAQYRRFAVQNGIPVGARGRIHPDVKTAFGKAGKRKRDAALKG